MSGKLVLPQFKAAEVESLQTMLLLFCAKLLLAILWIHTFKRELFFNVRQW